MKSEKIVKIILALMGIVLIGFGVAFNASAALGNDPVGIIYDGMRNTLSLSPEQLGMASNVVNISLIILVFLLDRHYVNIGTLIYILPYGFMVDLGGKVFHSIFSNLTLITQIMGAAIGTSLLCIGVAFFITADIGVDPFTGIVMILKDKTKKEYTPVKIGFDIACIALGVILGGKIGVITIVTAIICGPMIQFFVGIISKI